MKDIKILGVDIAKDVFQLCGIDEWGKVIYTRRVKRAQYVSTVASLKVGCVVMEGLKALIERRGMNRACVALANKNARIIWALLTRQETYRCGA